MKIFKDHYGCNIVILEPLYNDVSFEFVLLQVG